MLVNLNAFQKYDIPVQYKINTVLSNLRIPISKINSVYNGV